MSSILIECTDNVEKLICLVSHFQKIAKSYFSFLFWMDNIGWQKNSWNELQLPRANAELCINQVGLADFFDALIIGSDCKHAKPLFEGPSSVECIKRSHICLWGMISILTSSFSYQFLQNNAFFEDSKWVW